MSESCNCITEHLEKIKQSIIEQILPDNAIPESLEVKWKNKALMLDGESNSIMLKAGCEYQQVKKGGELYKSMTKIPISIAVTYCPFCGVKY